MDIQARYKNYDLHPCTVIRKCEGQAWRGSSSIVSVLKARAEKLLQTQKKVVISFEFYPGVNKEELFSLAKELHPCCIMDTEDFAKSEEVLQEEFRDFITDDRVFGVICHKKLDAFFVPEKLEEARRQLEGLKEGIAVVAGVGAALVSEGDIYVYCNLTRWEVQLRYRAGQPNWHCTNTDDPILTKYKKSFFIGWRLADRFKKVRYERIDYMLDSETPGDPKMITGDAFRSGLDQLSRRPFRMEPYFDPGVWGGHWMQNNFGLDPTQKNFAWSFDGVPEENSLNLQFGDITVKLPALDLVLYRPRALLGERVHGRFGAEFPIRFDLLDTMGGGNLSLQVHPLTEYIQDTFGMHYTQDESYYLLDADEDSDPCVYLGLQKNVDKEAFERDLRRAEKGEIAFPAEKYVNRIPVRKHDHVLIPAGTIHCSGKNTMVLEISATPYIFTFKLWDWGRLGLDGLPRPIHIDHGMPNIQWYRDTDWVQREILHQEKTVDEGEGYKVERTGLHNREFIDTHRYDLTVPYEVDLDDSVHMMNLVEGSHVLLESTDGSFEPFELHYAETAIVPASVGRYRIVPENGEQIKLVVADIRR